MLGISVSKINQIYKLQRKLWPYTLWECIRQHCQMPNVVMNNGNEMPILGFGTWNSVKDLLILERIQNEKGLNKKDTFSKEAKNSSLEVAHAVGLAIDAGYRHIDCAQLYNNEKIVGQVIKSKIKGEVLKRDDLFISSKLWNTFHDPKHVCSACAKTLCNLQLDYVDMYLMHSPMSFEHGEALLPSDSEGDVAFDNVHFCDTWKAMEDLVDKRMCKNIGVCNFNQKQLECLLQNCRIIPQTLQLEVHPYLAQKDLIHFAKWNDICINSYAPLGLFNHTLMEKPRTLLKDYKVLQLAKKHERSPGQILLRYQIQLGLSPIFKPANRQCIVEYINIFDFELSTEDMLNLDSLNHNMRYLDFSCVYGHPHHPFE